MALTESTMMNLGTEAPDFMLPDTVSGNTYNLTALKGDVGTVITFICNHCPYVKHVNRVLVQLANEFQPQGISFVAISSNDVVQYPEDGPVAMKATAEALGYPFPYLYDETQEVAHSYDAVCTPDTFVFNKDLKLAYRGRIDDTRPLSGIPANGNELRAALRAMLAGQFVSEIQYPAMGCSIKWKD